MKTKPFLIIVGLIMAQLMSSCSKDPDPIQRSVGDIPNRPTTPGGHHPPTPIPPGHNTNPPGVTIVEGASTPDELISIINAGEFIKPRSNHVKYFYKRYKFVDNTISLKGHPFTRESKPDGAIIRNSRRDRQNFGENYINLRESLIAIISAADRHVSYNDGTRWLFKVEGSSYIIDLNYPMAANPVREIRPRARRGYEIAGFAADPGNWNNIHNFNPPAFYPNWNYNWINPMLLIPNATGELPINYRDSQTE